MGSEVSEQVMVLLKELAVLKELEREQAARPNEERQQACRVREERQQEIGQEIKELAAQKKTKDAEESPSI